MIVKVVNITSWVGTSPGAEHYYASINEVETNRNVHWLLENMPAFSSTPEEKLERELTCEKEVKHLNKKDSWKGWRVGKITERFNTIEEIRELVSKKYPDNSIIFTYDHYTSTMVDDIIDRTKYDYVKTGRSLKVNGFEGFSDEFAYLTEGSIHEIIETPEKYKHKTNMVDGYWVMGVTEPVKVLPNECDIL